MNYNDSPQQQKPSSMGVFLVLGVCMLSVPVLIYITGGFFGYVLLLVGGVVTLGCLHWVWWGQALTQEVAQESQEAKLRQKAEEVAEWEDPYGITSSWDQNRDRQEPPDQITR